jgi:hypothetical protein
MKMSASNDSSEPCLHCLLNEAIDDFVEDRIESGDECVGVEKIVDDLVACICELIATNPDAEMREAYADVISKLIPERVRHFRETGRYPGDVTDEPFQYGAIH